MKNIIVIALLISSCFIVSCDRNTGTDPQTETLTTTKTLVTNPWKVNKITDLNGNTINPAALPTEAKALFSINIQFLEDKTVRALDPVSKSIVNGGKWDLLDSEKTLDIDVAQLKGKYPIVEITRTKMVLRNTIVFEGATFNVNLELVPAI